MIFIFLLLLSCLFNASLISSAGVSLSAQARVFGTCDLVRIIHSFDLNPHWNLLSTEITEIIDTAIEDELGLYFPIIPTLLRERQLLYERVLRPILAYQNVILHEYASEAKSAAASSLQSGSSQSALHNQPSPSDLFWCAFDELVRQYAANPYALEQVLSRLDERVVESSFLKILLERVRESGALFTAIYKYSLDDSEYWLETCQLLAERVPIDITNFVSGDGLLASAINEGLPVLCELFLALGAPVNVTNFRGQTPLHLATLSNMFSLCVRLLERDAGMFAMCMDENSIVHYAAMGNNVQLLRHLDPEIVSCLCFNNSNSLDPLALSIEFNSDSAFFFLLELTTPSKSRINELFVLGACSRTHLPILERLLIEGACPNVALDEHHNTPLHYAVAFEDINRYELLIAHGANPNLQNCRGLAAKEKLRILYCS